MADQYAPKTEQVRRYWQYGANAWADGVARDDDMHPVDGSIGEEFDRWLAVHDAQVLRDAADRIHAIHGGTSRASEYHHDYAERLQDEAARMAGGTSDA